MNMQILDWNNLDTERRRAALARPRLDSLGDVEALARSIIREVRKDGDAALLAFASAGGGAIRASATGAGVTAGFGEATAAAATFGKLTVVSPSR